MKSTWILVASLGCNALLVHQLAQTGNREREIRSRKPLAAPVQNRAADSPNPSSQTANGLPPLVWAGLESPDYPTYVANLRAVGCPPETVRDILVADVHALFAKQRRDLRTRGRGLEFPTRLAIAESRRDEQAVLDALLGPNWSRYAEDRVQSDGMPEVLQGVDPDTVSRVLEIEGRYATEIQAFLTRTGGVELDQDHVELREIRDRKWKALAETLPPEQYVEYLKDHHPVASSMKFEGFTYKDESEFLAVLAERERLEGEPRTTGTDAEVRIQALLGSERYESYQRFKRPEYRELRALLQRYGLEEEISAQVQEVVDQFTRAQTARVPMHPGDAIARIQHLLGQNAFEAWSEAGFAPELTSN